MDDELTNEIGRRHNGGSFVIETHQTAEEIASLLGISTESVNRFAQRGKWPHFKQPSHGGYRRMFCDHDLHAIMDTLEVSTDAKPN